MNAADDRERNLWSELATTATLHRWSNDNNRTDRLQRTVAALDDWRNWASGHPLDPSRLTDTVHTLASTYDSGRHAAYESLADTIIDWADHYAPDLAPALTAPPTPSLGIELPF